jgi:hypothetical protein
MTVKVCDDYSLCATCAFTLKVLNDAPVFVEALQDQSVVVWDTLIYIFPATFDTEGDPVTVSVTQVGSPVLPTFMVFNNVDTLTIHTIDNSNSGSYQINVTLTDGLSTTDYQFTVIVREATL